MRVPLPGIDPKDVQIEVTGNTLTVRGDRNQKDESRESYLSEISYGRFERRFTVPKVVDTKKVSASYRHGMLELTLPYEEAAKPRRIEIAGEDVHSIKAA